MLVSAYVWPTQVGYKNQPHFYDDGLVGSLYLHSWFFPLWGSSTPGGTFPNLEVRKNIHLHTMTIVDRLIVEDLIR